MNKINNNIKKTVGLLVLASFLVLPGLTLADSKAKAEIRIEKKEIKKEKREEERNEKEDNDSKNSTSCFRAWGHLFAPGWVKLNGSANYSGNCIFPFGIGKKFRTPNATSTPDTTAPVISNLFVSPNRTSAVVEWSTDELSDSLVYFSTNSSVNTNASSTSKTAMVRAHRADLKDLTPGTTYYAMVVSKDKSGNVATSGAISFTTLAPVADTMAPTISSIFATIGSTTVSAWWKTNENATSKIYYSTTTPINLTSSLFVENNTLTTNHNISISGLATSTPYHLLIESKDGVGNTQRTDEFLITTISGI